MTREHNDPDWLAGADVGREPARPGRDVARMPQEPRARGVVPPTPPATEAPRGGYIPPPGYGLPVCMPFPDSIDDEGLPQ